MLATALYLLTTAFAAEVVDTRNTLNVTGTGEIWVEPDEAVLTLGVRAQGDTAGAAFDAAAKKMATVNASLATSVPAERIRTSQLSLQPRYDYTTNGTPRLIGYEASATVEIRVDDPTAVGKVLDNAVAAGANEVHGVAWKVEDEDLARQEALDAAVEDAHGNAELVAAQLGVPLGEPIRVTIRVQESMPNPYYYMERGDAAMDVDVASMPVRAGEQIYAAQVDVTFAIGGEQPAEVPEAPPEDEPDIPGDPTS